MGRIKMLYWKVEVSVRETLLKSEWVGVEPAHPVEVWRKWVSCIAEEWGETLFIKTAMNEYRVYKSGTGSPQDGSSSNLSLTLNSGTLCQNRDHSFFFFVKASILF